MSFAMATTSSRQAISSVTQRITYGDIRTGIHRSCFLSWAHREEFIARFNSTIGSITWDHGGYQEMQPDGTIVMRRRDSEDSTQSD
jgi:hypothetical protein